jgi:hypothetical protein
MQGGQTEGRERRAGAAAGWILEVRPQGRPRAHARGPSAPRGWRRLAGALRLGAGRLLQGCWRGVMGRKRGECCGTGGLRGLEEGGINGPCRGAVRERLSWSPGGLDAGGPAAAAIVGVWGGSAALGRRRRRDQCWVGDDAGMGGACALLEGMLKGTQGGEGGRGPALVGLRKAAFEVRSRGTRTGRRGKGVRSRRGGSYLFWQQRRPEAADSAPPAGMQRNKEGWRRAGAAHSAPGGGPGAIDESAGSPARRGRSGGRGQRAVHPCGEGVNAAAAARGGLTPQRAAGRHQRPSACATTRAAASHSATTTPPCAPPPLGPPSRRPPPRRGRAARRALKRWR